MTTATASPRHRRSLAAQPWFAGAMGLWFAALFGLSSLAVAPELLERAVGAIGLDRVFPAAAPPLGETARLLIAVAVSAVGEIAGLLLGRAIARAARGKPQPAEVDAAASEADETEFSAPMPLQRARDRHPDAPPRRPLVASEELVLRDAPVEPADHPAEPDVESAPPLSPLAAAPLEDLGAAQLTERLALALTARKDRGAVPAGLGSRLGSLAGLEGARLGASDGDEADDGEDDEDEEAGDDSAYSSLLNIGTHHARRADLDEPEPEDFDEDQEVEPVAVFPAPPVAAPAAETAETDRALRAALNSLERFSGTR